MAADIEGDVYVLVEHPFEYTGKDGRRVAIQPNERYRLLRRSTEHWWHVRREPGGRPFYLPAQYVRELPPPAGLLGNAGSLKACSVAGSWVCPRPLARSDSENVYEAIQDVRGPPREERPQQLMPRDLGSDGGWERSRDESQSPSCTPGRWWSVYSAPAWTRRSPRALVPCPLLRTVDDPPEEPVYENVERQPSVPSPGASAPPRPPAWETHTDAGSGRPYYYNPDTGVTTWESPFEAAEGAASPATSPASVGSRESLETDWGQYWDEESRRVFFYNPLTGEAVWEDEPEDEPEDELEMQPGLSPLSPRELRPPTPETDYPESLTGYPEEDYSPVGSFSEPRSTSPLAAPPGWSCQVNPDGQTLYTNHFTQEQVRAAGTCARTKTGPTTHPTAPARNL
ncbi:rho GTPase-activating protein 27-like [Leptonychotes weddellii]|uniref:Rho GTPase-activating protein 27-like n=1 Tax=Leptonychotes weddellii TaxID=9713 RepID=A0A7F8R1V2_LEPWE|nr:rho GTPase-activating protein 27-like [Leptonychotes weddellii]